MEHLGGRLQSNELAARQDFVTDVFLALQMHDGLISGLNTRSGQQCGKLHLSDRFFLAVCGYCRSASRYHTTMHNIHRVAKMKDITVFDAGCRIDWLSIEQGAVRTATVFDQNCVSGKNQFGM